MKMSMTDSIDLLWPSPSLFRWDRFIFETFLLVDHSAVECWCLSMHYEKFFCIERSTPVSVSTTA